MHQPSLLHMHSFNVRNCTNTHTHTHMARCMGWTLHTQTLELWELMGVAWKIIFNADFNFRSKYLHCELWDTCTTVYAIIYTVVTPLYHFYWWVGRLNMHNFNCGTIVAIAGQLKHTLLWTIIGIAIIIMVGQFAHADLNFVTSVWIANELYTCGHKLLDTCWHGLPECQ